MSDTLQRIRLDLSDNQFMVVSAAVACVYNLQVGSIATAIEGLVIASRAASLLSPEEYMELGITLKNITAARRDL